MKWDQGANLVDAVHVDICA